MRHASCRAVLSRVAEDDRVADEAGHRCRAVTVAAILDGCGYRRVGVIGRCERGGGIILMQVIYLLQR